MVLIPVIRSIPKSGLLINFEEEHSCRTTWLGYFLLATNVSAESPPMVPVIFLPSILSSPL